MDAAIKSLFIISAIMLLSFCASATKCVVIVLDEQKMPINHAKLYLDNWSNFIGTTDYSTYTTGIDNSCWIGEISVGSHMLSAKKSGTTSRPPYNGSAIVEISNVLNNSYL